MSRAAECSACEIIARLTLRVCELTRAGSFIYFFLILGRVGFVSLDMESTISDSDLDSDSDPNLQNAEG